MLRPIHPFPARMAPDLAIRRLSSLSPRSVVLDPMSGSGTVVRHAADLGFKAIGFDMDPLAVLMARAWTTAVDDDSVQALASEVLYDAIRTKAADIDLPWIDKDAETRDFVNYWFGSKQKLPLRKLAIALHRRRVRGDSAAARAKDVLKVALSRIIITKDQGATLGRDISHSRPHKEWDETDFDVFDSFERSVKRVRELLKVSPPKGTVRVELGDARCMKSVVKGSVDAVLTSPPYLNAIDYMRGHRLALVWFGYSLTELRAIRSSSIGTERGLKEEAAVAKAIVEAMGAYSGLPSRHGRMVVRYAVDLLALMKEISRVLKPKAKATLVVGNSCLKGVFIKNSAGVATAGELSGLKLVEASERELPAQNRYLPMSGSLQKRIRTETILVMEKAKAAA